MPSSFNFVNLAKTAQFFSPLREESANTIGKTRDSMLQLRQNPQNYSIEIVKSFRFTAHEKNAILLTKELIFANQKPVRNADHMAAGYYLQ